MLPVYLQTGEQSDFSAVEEAGYEVILRSDILAILHQAINDGSSNIILHDYYKYLKWIEDAVNSYRNEKDEWNEWYGWQGFYQELKREALEGFDDCHWGYSANARGGFLVFYWHWRECPKGKVYLQIEHTLKAEPEQNSICFKIKPDENVDRREMRWFWHEKILESAEKLGFPACKPARFGNGKHMTVAVYYDSTQSDNPLEFRIFKPDGRFDFDATVNTILKAQRVLDHAVKSLK